MSWKYRQDEVDYALSTGMDLNAIGGVRPAPALFAVGGQSAQIAADGVNSTPVITEIYCGAVWVPSTCLATGVALFNGSDATDKAKVGLFDAHGTLLRASAAAGTQMSGTDAYQNIPFALDGANAAATTILLPPGMYFIGVIFNGTTSRFNAFGVGAFPGGKITGAVFSTAFSTTSLSITPPTGFTAAGTPPIASLY